MLAPAIRAVDPNHVILYEPVTWGIYSGIVDLGTGFTEVPGGSAFRSLSALSFHYYCWLLIVSDYPNPYPYWKQVICDDIVFIPTFNTFS